MTSDVRLSETHLVAWLILRGTCGYCPCLCAHSGRALPDRQPVLHLFVWMPQPGQHLLTQAAPHRSRLCGACSGGRQGGLPGRATPTHSRQRPWSCARTLAWVTSGTGLCGSARLWARPREVEVGSY